MSFKRFKKHLNKIKPFLFQNEFQRDLNKAKKNKSKAGVIELFGMQFNYHHGRAFFDTYQEIFLSQIYKFETNSKTPMIVDCGANMGLSLLYFSRLFENAKIIAFEPDEVVLPFLISNIREYSLTQVDLIKKAVWISNDNLNFYTDNGMGGRLGIEYKSQKPKTIQTVRLKDYLIEPIDMLKIDIEGAEYMVLKDCEDNLINVSNIFVEYHSLANEEQYLGEVLSLLKRQGFRYHLKESFSRQKPFVDSIIACQRYDLAINIFAYRNEPKVT